MKLKRIRFVILYVVILTVLFLIFYEIFLRFYFKRSGKDINIYRPAFFFSNIDIPADKKRFKSHPFLPYAPKENDSRKIHVYRQEIGKVLTYDYTNNSLGFRTKEFAFQKQAGVKRIVVLGGSTTWDGPTNDKTWPSFLEKKLNEYYKDRNTHIEVINLAMDGAFSYVSLTILNLLGVMYEPDLVISYDGVNDVNPSGWKDVVPDYSNYYRDFNDRAKSLQLVIPRWLYHSYTISVLSKAFDTYFQNEATNVIDAITRKSPLKFTDKTVASGLDLYLRNLKLMRGVCREYKCQFVASIPHWAVTNDFLEYFDSATRSFFQQENIDYLDLQSILPHNDYSIHSDFVHWTDKGLDLIAEEWLKKITSRNLLSF